MNYRQTIDFLYTKLPMFQRVGAAALKYSLDNTVELLRKLGNPHQKIKTIHIAGTNGKGSSAHMLASILQEEGLKTGLFTSPHLKSFTERIRVDGEEIPETAVVDFVTSIEGLIDDLHPSFFEITFAMAMHHFYCSAVEVAVIEVGLGGRLDSTNIINPEICLITNIDYDHQQFLGDTLPEIAAEKAGIIKSGVPVVISEYQPEIAATFNNKAIELGSDICFASNKLHVEAAADNKINVVMEDQVILDGLEPDLIGSYQRPNIVGVVAVVQKIRELNILPVSDVALRQGLANVVRNTGLKGRWQILNLAPLTIVDTAHNIGGVKVVIEELTRRKYDNLHIVWGMVADKAVAKILPLLPREAVYYFVEAEVPRSLKLAILLQEAAKAGLSGSGYQTVMAGFRAAKDKATAEDLIFIGGSTFVVAEIDEL
jgi:dihydrofolate synthase / folylpolyglutamate synthase